MSASALKKCQEINTQLTEENAVLKAVIEQLNNVHNTELTELTEEEEAALAEFADEQGIPKGGYRRVRRHRTKKYRSKKSRGTKRR